jgi:hypothetical protein
VEWKPPLPDEVKNPSPDAARASRSMSLGFCDNHRGLSPCV